MMFTKKKYYWGKKEIQYSRWVADDIVDSSVSSWIDRNTGKELIQDNASYKPTVVSSYIDGHKAVLFNGVNQFLYSPDTNIVNPINNGITTIIVGKALTDGAYIAKSLYGETPDRWWMVYSNGYIHSVSETVARTRGNWEILSLRHDNNYAFTPIYKNIVHFMDKKNKIGSGALQSITPNSFNLIVGAYNNGSGGVPPASGVYCNCYIAEIIIIQDSIPNAQFNSIIDMLTTLYPSI